MPTIKILGFYMFSVAVLTLSCQEEVCLLTADINVVTIDANTKELTVVPSGGVGPYKVTWLNNLVITRDIDSIVATKLGFPYGPGLYEVTVEDVGGCEATASVNIKFDGSSCPFYLNIDTSRAFLGDKMAFHAKALYGDKPYQYRWSTGSTDSILLIQNPTGAYGVTVTSAIGCVMAKEIVLIIGKTGNPRFNLQFSNHANIDLDLYVRTPSGQLIWFGDHFGDGGEFDVDCKCEDCPSGPTENIFWQPGTAPKGIYTFWVEVYAACSGAAEESTYSLHRMNLDKIEATYTGVLSTVNTKSPEYTFDHQ